MRVTLAGATIDIRCEAGTEALAEAFLPAPRSAAASPDLRVAMRLDTPHLDARIPGQIVGAQHYRLGKEHTWIAPQPRQLQRLLSGREARAELVVDEGSIQDGAIRARPAVDAISAWAASRGVMPLHASAVVKGGQALLFLGEGGRGKTTTALALALRGWDLLADDRCFLEASPAGMVVHGLYPTVILTPTTAERLGASDWGDLGRTHEGKWARHLPPTMSMVPTAALRGVIALTHGREEPYGVGRLDRAATLASWQAAFAPAVQAHGPSAGWLRSLSLASRSVPAWSLTLGWDFCALDSALNALLGVAAGGAA